jgi:hypothetical protein
MSQGTLQPGRRAGERVGTSAATAGRTTARFPFTHRPDRRGREAGNRGIMLDDEAIDCSLQVDDRSEDAAFQSSVCELSLVQRLCDIRNQIRRIFDAYRQPDRRVENAHSLADVSRDAGMGHTCGQTSKRFSSAKADR